MGEVLRVRPARANGTETRLRKVEGDVATLTHTLRTNRAEAKAESAATLTALAEVMKRLGKPENGHAEPASGLYFALEEMGTKVDGVSERVKPFESLWLQVKGGAKTVAALALPVAALVWFLAGDRITLLLHG